MSIASSSDGTRTALDYALIAVAGLVLLGFLGLGLYGSSTGFLQTKAYYKSSDVVSLGCAAISAGCGLYLMLELVSRPAGRAIFGVCVVCGMFGFFAVSKGIPAAVTMSSGHRGTVVFTITRFDWGSRNCSSTVVAENPAYEVSASASAISTASSRRLAGTSRSMG